MSGYLQRLFDRGAGWGPPPAAAAADVAPAMVPGSPAFAFDQRLADPGLAGLFAILGVPPDLDLLAQPESQEDGSAAVAASVPTAATPTPVLHPLPTRDAKTPARQENPPRARAEPGPPLTLRAERQSPRRADNAPLPSPPVGWLEPRDELRPAAVDLPSRLPQEPSLPGEAAPVAREARAQPAVVVSARPSPAAPAQVALQPVVEVAPASTVQPAAPVLPPPSPFAAQPARAAVREVEPPRRAPAPLAPPAAAATDAREVERIARDAVRAELARRPGAPAPAEARRADADASAAETAPKAAPRPASAREASVIGELEPSSSPLTIYGLRMR